MHNELNRSIATEQYNDHVRQAQQRALANQAPSSRPRIIQATVRIVANLLVASGESLLNYSEAESAQTLQEVARHA
jgi:hypothetical protein